MDRWTDIGGCTWPGWKRLDGVFHHPRLGNCDFATRHDPIGRCLEVLHLFLNRPQIPRVVGTALGSDAWEKKNTNWRWQYDYDISLGSVCRAFTRNCCLPIILEMPLGRFLTTQLVISFCFMCMRNMFDCKPRIMFLAKLKAFQDWSSNSITPPGSSASSVLQYIRHPHRALRGSFAAINNAVYSRTFWLPSFLAHSWWPGTRPDQNIRRRAKKEPPQTTYTTVTCI